jgi:hypothetical protein
MLWRQRQRWHRAEKALTLQALAFCRSFAHGDKGEAQKLFACAKEDPDSCDANLVTVLAPFLLSIEIFRPQRKMIEKQLRVIARSLPIWPWVSAVHGFGDLNFAGIVGEADDIGRYANVAKFWKWMGLAVIDGRAQRKVAGDAAAIHKYNPARRSVTYLLGEALIKAGGKCRYRSVYDERRAHTAVTHPDWTKGHSHADGMRVMTKRVIADLWGEWKRHV